MKNTIQITEVKKLPKWLKKGIGVNGGGDLVGTQVIMGRRVKLYMSWHGINSKAITPAYFKFNNRWFRISHEDIDV